MGMGDSSILELDKIVRNSRLLKFQELGKPLGFMEVPEQKPK